ncbi:hypothetical protein R1flu_016751 [Riccia fluitans]|uniref:Gag protein n=1 Tax=Riccia fluitans TaxID=41844 RepID=A0ABD1YNK0_9MARC
MSVANLINAILASLKRSYDLEDLEIESIGKRKMCGLLPKFDGTCFYLWRVNFELYLQREKLLPIVSGTEPRPDEPMLQAAWDEKDLQARLIILAALAIPQKKHIISCQTAHESYKTLMTVFGAAELVMLTGWLDRFRSMKLKEGHSVAKHLAELTYTIGVFNLRGVTINDYESKINLLRSMPDSYRHLVQELRSNPDLKLQDVVRMLLQEEMEKKAKATEDGQFTAVSMNRRPYGKKRTPPPAPPFRISRNSARRSPDLGPPPGTKSRPQTDHGRPQRRSYGGYSGDMANDFCTFCKEMGHTVETCVLLEMKREHN